MRPARRHATLAIVCASALSGCAVLAELATTYVAGDATDGGADDSREDSPLDDASSDAQSDGPSSDAPGEASALDGCTDAPNVLACTDFPNGCPYGIQINGSGAVFGEAGTLRVTTDGGASNAFCYRKVTVSPKGFLYDVDLRVNAIDPAGAARGEIMQVEAVGPLDYTLSIVGGKLRFVGANAAEMEVAPNVALGTWQHVSIDVDYVKHTATVTVGANPAKVVPIGTDTPALTQLDVGFDFLQGTNLAWDVTYDNWLVRSK